MVYGKQKNRFIKVLATGAATAGSWYGRHMADKIVRSGNEALQSYAARPSYRDYVAAKKMSGEKKRKVVTTKKVFRPPVNSQSAGKLTTKRYRRTKRQKNAAKGVETTVEVAKSAATTSQVLWIGHSTHSNEDIRFSMWRVVVKKLFVLMGQPVRFISDNLSGYNISPNDAFVVAYQNTDGVAGSIIYTVVAGSTFDDVVNGFYGNAGLQSEQITLKYISFSPTVNVAGTGQDSAPVRLDLEFAYIQMYCKSSMKIQNRTVNVTASGGNEDSVDNVPLYGRIYGGTGNGAVYAGKSAVVLNKQLIADKTNGFIEGDAADGLLEPWHQMYFQYVTQKGKVHLDPGFIKTSSLEFRRNISLTLLNRRLSQISSGTKVRDPLGKFRFFGLERMIDTSPLGTPGEVNVGLEINYYHCLSIYNRFPNVTLPVFARRILP